MKSEIMDVYYLLLEKFGEQEWWPMKRTFRPKEFEVIVGAILTQNTNWKNVEKALDKLEEAKLTDAKKISKTHTKKLESTVRSSGFYKQKAERLKDVSKKSAEKYFYKNVTREELLSIKGIGKETADSILLYACDRPFFVIDAYTKRIFSRLGMIHDKLEYDKIRAFFENGLPKDIYIYKEFHALIVELAKSYCKKKPLCDECPLKDLCKFYLEDI